MGYCNTTGLKNMDYIISDPNLIYKDEKNLYTEEVLYLPEIWNTHCGFDFERKENPPPLIKNNYITFGSFNNPSKISENVIFCWSKILKKININAVVIVIHRAELVKEISNPRKLMSTMGCISNCFRGLSPLAIR